MHATIRRYRGADGRSEELERRIREIASRLSGARGFVSCFILEAEPGVLAEVAIFEDRSGLEEAERLTGASLRARRAHLLLEEPEVTSGEVVFQRGL